MHFSLLRKLDRVSFGFFFSTILPKTFLISIIDVFSLGAAYYIIRLTSNNDSMESGWELQVILSALVLFILGRLYLLKGLNDSIHYLRHVLSRGILERFMANGVTSLNSGLSSLSSEMFGEVEQVVNSFIVPFSNLIQSLVISAFVMGVLLYLYPGQTITIFSIFIVIYVVIYRITNTYGKRISNERLVDNASRFSVVANTINTYKSIRVYGVIRSVLKHFDTVSIRLSKNIGRNQTLSAFPKYLVESVVYISMTVYLIFTTSDQLELEFLLILGVSALKLLPSFQSSYHAINHLRFGVPAVRGVIRILIEDYEENTFNVHGTRELVKLHVKNFSYDDKPLLEDVTLVVNQNEIVSIVGPSGSGKSTILDMVLGITRLSAGSLTYNESFGSRDEFLTNVGYVPQNYDLIEGTILDNILFNRPSQNLDKKWLFELILDLGLDNLIKCESDLSRVLDLQGEGLSGGQKQRIAMCRALIFKPQLLILDEPTSALDTKNETALFKMLKKLSENMGILIISHNMDVLKISDRVTTL